MKQPIFSEEDIKNCHISPPPPQRSAAGEGWGGGSNICTASEVD